MIDKNTDEHNHLAFKEKDLEDIKKRKLEYTNFIQLKNTTSSQNISNNHLLYPTIDNLVFLNETLEKLSFSLPNDNNIKIIVPVKKVIEKDSLQILKDKYSYIYFIDENEISSYAKDSIILIHCMDEIEYNDILLSSSRVEIIDKNFYSDVESESLRKLYYKTFTPTQKREFSEISRKNFNEFKLKNIHKREAICFTSGPSFDNYKDFKFNENSLKIICNSIIKNRDFLTYINNADLLAFGDPVFHFGPSEYAKLFRNDVIEQLKNSDCYITIPEINVPLMIFHYPELKNKIIGMRSESTWNFPSNTKFYIKNTANILTLLMLPLASSISDTIFILGADGRKEGENYFWNHSKTAQYNDQMESVFKTHPSFFRDRVYDDYYKEHCEILEQLISYGEALGKIYFSITESYIPALNKRFINYNQQNIELKKEIELKREENKEKYLFQEQTILNSTSISEVNKDFAIKMNLLYKYIEEIKDNKIKIAIYGNGLIGNIFARELKEQLVVIVDQNPASKSEFGKTCIPSELKNYEFDFIIITVLGRESSIINNLDIEKNKIVTINLKEEKLNNLRLITIDKNSSEYKDQNILGPFARESKLNLDETNLVHRIFNKPNGLMIDVGAHFGSSAKPFLNMDWEVHCYEPDPSNRKKLEENLLNYKKLTISDKAISNKNDKLVSFYNSEESTGVSSLLPFSDKHQKSCEVTTTTLKKEIEDKNISHVDFLKIDTEGYDLLVLKSFPWDKMKPSIIECEYEDNKTTQLGYKLEDLITYLKEMDYHVYISEWHPIIRYGIKHEWKRFFEYTNQEINTNSWGNILAFKSKPDEKFLKEKIIEILNLEGKI